MVSLIKLGVCAIRNRDGTAFLQVVQDLEEYARTNSDPALLGSVQEARFALEKLVQKMDNLEAGFDRIAERSRKRYLSCPLRIVCSCGCLSALCFSVISVSQEA